MTTSDRRSPTLRLVTVAAVLAVAIAPSVWFVRALSGVPTPIVLAAAAPALVWAWLVTRIDRRHPEPWWALAAALLAGAVLAASTSHVVNGWLLDWANAYAGAAGGRPLAGGFGAPIVEELAKSAAFALLVLVVRHLVEGTLDGIVYGALVGIGFAFTENVIYLTFAVLQGGSGG